MSKPDDVTLIPDLIFDDKTKITYKKGRFYGKGGFGKCYELINMCNNATFAGKIVSKKLMVKEEQRQKMAQEIHIHKDLKHKNVVGFYSYFEDNFNIYIVLELCKKKSMMELQKRRKLITEPETRFYMKQILSGVGYLHHNRIIHRDLKLGNLFLNDDLHVKIGDFGLAAVIAHEGERKETLCGTPNYIAPEILRKKGHSFEVDVWSLGCIMYTLLIGKPPFESSSLKETYARIKKCEYKLAGNITPSAKHMIMIMLQSEPKNRPKISQLNQHEFLSGFCPSSLPESCLTMAPRYDRYETAVRKPLSGINNGEIIVKGDEKFKSEAMAAHLAGNFNYHLFDAKESFMALHKLLSKALKMKPAKNYIFLDEMTDPAAQPLIWVSKWVDYSDKYGFGYQLSDEGVGVMFNDTTKLILLPNGIDVHYIDKANEECYMTLENYQKSLDKKMKLLSYFTRYMREHLMKTGASIMRDADALIRTPHLHQWCRSTSGVLMQLNNGTVQMNFSDHTKIIMCPLMAAITYIDEEKQFRTFRFSSLENNGCNVALYEKMKYALDKITVLLSPDANLMPR